MQTNAIKITFVKSLCILRINFCIFLLILFQKILFFICNLLINVFQLFPKLIFLYIICKNDGIIYIKIAHSRKCISENFGNYYHVYISKEI